MCLMMSMKSVPRSLGDHKDAIKSAISDILIDLAVARQERE